MERLNDRLDLLAGQTGQIADDPVQHKRNPTTIAAAEHEPADSRPVRSLLADLRRLGYRIADLEAHLGRPDSLAQSEDPGWTCSRAIAAQVTACYDLLTEMRRPGRLVDEPKPGPHHVVCGQQHPRLDRKQATWPIDSSSPATARSS